MTDSLRQALAALHAARFAEARDLAAPWTASPMGAVLHALGLAAAGDVDAGATALAAIARANPTARHPVLDLSDLLDQAGQTASIPPHLRAALTHQNDPAILQTLGAALARTGPIHESLQAFDQATRLAPNQPAAWSNLGKTLAAIARFDDAETAFATAQRLAPNDPQITLNRGIALLKAGRWPEAWPRFRARHALPGHAPTPPGPELRSLDDAKAKTILLLHDEGFGDTIQFIRYAPLLATAARAVLLSVPPPLQRLLHGIPGLTPATTPLQHYDAWLRIPDLPALFQSTPKTIPPALSTLHHSPQPTLPPGRRIGLVWAGASRRHDPAAAATDRLRSLDPAQFAPLLATPGITWINLQKDRTPPPGIHDPMPGAPDFAATAAIIAALDLVVSVDTAAAHLAATLGKPVLLLDRFDNCWRWLHDRTDTPWYPQHLQILRQPTPGDWSSVIQQAARHLSS